VLYLINTVRHVYLYVPHPKNLTPSWQGHSVGWYEGDTLVIDTAGIKATPLSTIYSALPTARHYMSSSTTA
jgi:hypothetical protein